MKLDAHLSKPIQMKSINLSQSSSSEPDFFATCPKNLESLLADELKKLGAGNVQETRAGVGFKCSYLTAYRICLWSRIASRVLLPLTRFEAPTPEAIYASVKAIDWRNHIIEGGTLAVDFNCVQSSITHSHYGALKVKDAIVDQLRDSTGVRPSINTETPDLRVNVYLHRDIATLSIDWSGTGLHQRGYRTRGVVAPLKENLAAAILLRAAWPDLAQQGRPLIDLMCGSGTFLIEGAMIAADIAPGLLRNYYGFLNWPQHDSAIWQSLIEEARNRRDAGLKNLPPVCGYDHDSRAIQASRENIMRAGLSEQIKVKQRALADCAPEPGSEIGLVIANPPYGARLGTSQELQHLYTELGVQLRKCFKGWRCCVFTGNPLLGKHIGIRAQRMHTLFNGQIECKLLHFSIEDKWYMREHQQASSSPSLSAGAEMFANRLRKNIQHIGRWAERNGISCYRLYDADLPEYNLAIDLYRGDELWVIAQEYEAPKAIDPRTSESRFREALTVISRELEITDKNIYTKLRRRQADGNQYDKISAVGNFHVVHEGPCVFLVNFTDYLDTGLFLDHRLTREMVGKLAIGKKFLNLFGYTGTATVHAALAGASCTTTVDMSQTYLTWARQNFELNGMNNTDHIIIRADVIKWLKENRKRRYDVIFLDPPTFSRSKRMTTTLDIQRDHVSLIRDAVTLLAADGILIFSTNNRRFKLDYAAMPELTVKDISRQTIPKDFERNPRIHQCFRISCTNR